MRRKIYKDVYVTDKLLNTYDEFKLYKSKYKSNNLKIEFKDYDETVETLKQIDKLVNKGIIFKNYILINYTEEIIEVFKAIFIKDKREKYKYIYETTCDNLDKIWSKYNPCKFCNNKCISTRHKNNYLLENGCCYEFTWTKNMFKPIKGKKLCRHLGKDGKCTIKNLACKLFVCDYLNHNTNFRINIDEILLLNVFFNRKQFLIIKYNYFVKEDYVIDKLLEKDNTPYIIYLMTFRYTI